MSMLFRASRLTLMVLGLLTSVAAAESPAETIDLRPRIEPNTLTRVVIDLDAGGNDVVRAESIRQGAQGAQSSPPSAEQKLPMSVSAKLQYDERRLANPPTDGAQESIALAVRHYDKAEAVLKVDTTGLTPQLSENRRLIVVESGVARPTLYSPDGPLPRAELDLIDAIANSCLIDQLLPASAVAKGATWDHDAKVMGGLLGLDTIAVCEVQSVLDDFNASFAKIRLAGVVHGVADGAATQQEIRGVYLFDRRLHRATRLNLAVRETRSIGGATPGLQGVAKLQIKIEPISSSPRLTDEVVAAATRANKSVTRNLLYHSAPLGFEVEHDRQWFITSEAREQVTMRRVDGNDAVAHCNISVLPPKSEGRQIALEQFQKDVSYSLGKSFGQIVSSRQWANAHGHRCYEVVVRGTVEELPVEWHYYLVAPDSGHRVSLAFTIEGPLVERVGQADRDLVERLQLIPQQVAPAQTAARPVEPTKKQ